MDKRPAFAYRFAAMATREVESKGLKADALGFVSSVVIGVASTAPGYSLAAVLALVVAAVGVQAPAVLILAFLPMLFIAASYYYMNRADPDCGTTFSWVTRAMGPWAGWIGGWAIIVADIIVMANLAQIAGLYGFLLVGWESAADSTFAVTFVGVIWIAVMTAICVIGIELSARTQVGLLGAEVDHARAVRVHRALQGLRRRRARGLDQPGAELVLARSRSARRTAWWPACWWRCSSTGAGTARSASTRRRRDSGIDARARRRSPARSSWSASTCSSPPRPSRSPARRRSPATSPATRSGCSAPRCWASRWTRSW